MLIYLVSTTFFIIAFLIGICVLLLQRGKGDLGFSAGSGRGGQGLFGGSGGQDIFAKATWVLGLSFMLLSMVYAKMSHNYKKRSVLAQYVVEPEQNNVEDVLAKADCEVTEESSL